MIVVSMSTAKINEDNFGPEDDDIQFDDCGYGDDDDVDEVCSFYPSWLIPSKELSSLLSCRWFGSSCLCFLSPDLKTCYQRGCWDFTRDAPVGIF